MNYHPFVIPFTVGALFLFGVVFYKFYAWIAALDRKQKFMVKQNIFSFKTIRAIGEIFREALVHHNIYKKNPVLGYMHMSLAFGWFLLIVVGKIKASLYAEPFLSPLGWAFSSTSLLLMVMPSRMVKCSLLPWISCSSSYSLALHWPLSNGLNRHCWGCGKLQNIADSTESPYHRFGLSFR